MTADATSRAIAELLDLGEVRLSVAKEEVRVRVCLRGGQSFSASALIEPAERQLSNVDMLAWRIADILQHAAHSRDEILARRPKA